MPPLGLLSNASLSGKGWLLGKGHYTIAECISDSAFETLTSQ